MVKNADPLAQAIFIGAMIFVFFPLIAYLIAVVLRPLFVLLIIFSILAILVFGFLIFHEGDEVYLILLVISLISLVVFGGGWAITSNIIEEVPKTTGGKEQIKMYEDIVSIPSEVTETLDLALQQQVDELCKTYTGSCDSIKMVVKTEQDLMELQDWINKGRKIGDFVKSASKQS